MRNIKLEIEYDGTNYCGWQIQKGRQSPDTSHQKESIQNVIEKKLQKIIQEKVKLIGSGRTDAGVHAKAQVANFKTHSDIALDKLQEALNALLPLDIAVVDIEEVPFGFHSRFHSKSKLYRYTILNTLHRSALLRNYVHFCRYPLDLKLMQAEAKVLLGRHDFRAFCANNSNVKDTVRSIKRLSIKRYPLPLIIIDIEADGFLYNMVRNISGTLIEIGRGRFPRGSIKKILSSKDRRLAGPAAPAKGLCLQKVKY